VSGQIPSALIVRADAARLPLPDASVDLIVTSPPYFALRSYTDGGEHYAGQIGAEPTPREYIDALLRCTREWMRVLKPSGSMFINLGDAYSGKPSSDGTRRRDKAGARGERPTRRPRGRDMTREDAAWLAGVIDSDGSVSIRINKQPEGRAPSFVPWVRIGQMRPEVVQHAAKVTGIGQVMKDGRGVWNWCASAQQARWVLSRIYPWLHIKRRQAAAAIEVARHIEERNGRGEYRPLTDEDVAYRQRLRLAAMTWNAGQEDDLVPPEPAPIALSHYPLPAGEKSLMALPELYRIACIYELGLIARAVVVWSKPNGLPESVTDRVRRSHEDWIHLTKEPRYFSAVDAIREATDPAVDRRVAQYTGRKYGKTNNNRRDKGASNFIGNPLGKLPGSVWEVATEPLRTPTHRVVRNGLTERWFFSEADAWRYARLVGARNGRPSIRREVDHFAAMPSEWPRRLILGWSPPGGVVVDPFAGTGTTSLVASVLGRTGVSVDLSADYCRLARWRTTDAGERARAMRVPKPPPQTDGQQSLFDGAAS
jgi:DNA modification methylase